jgi:uncharacterized protein YjbI with pentapeptide repeats
MLQTASGNTLLYSKPMSQTAKPPKNSKKVNYIRWSSILSAPIAIAAIVVGVTVPEARCFLRLKSEVCAVQRQEIQLITQTETGEPLPSVKIQYISQGAPEVQYTDNNGFARVNIPSQGDVNIILTKEGYPTQNFTIDLQNEQSRTRTIRFTASGTPEVTALNPGTMAESASQPQTEIATSPADLPIGTANPGDAKKNFETLIRTKKCPNCYLVGVDLGSVNLPDADLRGTNLRGARVTGGSHLNGANLTGADLRGFSGYNVDFQGANFQEANLDGANLSGANLRGADLSNVDLSNVKLDRADLSGAILPEGFEPPQ